MRWKPKQKQDPFVGEIRFINPFLWLPRCIGGEWRWLERACIKQEFDCNLRGFSGWDDLEWWDTDQPPRPATNPPLPKTQFRPAGNILGCKIVPPTGPLPHGPEGLIFADPFSISVRLEREDAKDH